MSEVLLCRWNGKFLLLGNGDSMRSNRDVPMFMNSAEGGVRLRLRARNHKTTPMAATTRKARPPKTPPAMAPTGGDSTKLCGDVTAEGIVVAEPFDKAPVGRGDVTMLVGNEVSEGDASGAEEAETAGVDSAPSTVDWVAVG